MAEGLNRVMLLGNLGVEPELRYTQGGQAVLHLRLATTESYLDRDSHEERAHRLAQRRRVGEAGRRPGQDPGKGLRPVRRRLAANLEL